MNKSEIYELTEHIIKSKTTKDVFSIYNEWTKNNKKRITNYEEAIWVVEYIKSLQQVDENTIKLAQKIDKKIIEKERFL